MRKTEQETSSVPKVSVAKEINLKDIYQMLKRQIWIIVILTSSFTLFGAYINALPVTPLYQANTRIFLNSDANSFSTFVVMIREPVVIDEVNRRLDLGKSTGALINQIDVSSVLDSKIVSVTVTDSDPERAAQIADTTVEVYRETLTRIFGWSDVKVLTEASDNMNPYPINPKSNRMLYIGIIAGLVLGVGAALLRESLDDRIRGTKVIENQLGLQVLGQVNKISKKDIKNPKNASVELRGETIGS